ncbi:MAG TPA: hypothetical protein VGL68_01855 [Solirubrobacteraceae bacterium]|jgi:hypothetical protein
MDWGGLLLGAALAFIVALAVWWIQLRFAVPRLEFGEAISRLTHEGEAVYRFKVLNRGRRGAVDLAFSVSLHLGNELISYAEAPATKTFSILKLYPATDGVMRLRPKVSRVIRIDMRPHLWRDASPRLLAVAKIDPDAEELIALEALLSATPAVYLRVGVLANDEVSGTRKYFASQRYYLGHIRTGGFRGLAVGSSGGW